MKSFSLLAIAASAVLTSAKELPKNEELGASLYDSGIAHDRMMAEKNRQWDLEYELGLRAFEKYPDLGFVACQDGLAVGKVGDVNQTFQCGNVSHSPL